jgi:hypothetical protein
MNKRELFKNYTLTRGEVQVDNWGDQPVMLQELNAAAIDKMRSLGEGKELRAAVLAVIYGVVDENGKRVFADNDLDNLMKMSIGDLTKISDAVLKLSGMSE